MPSRLAKLQKTIYKAIYSMPLFFKESKREIL